MRTNTGLGAVGHGDLGGLVLDAAVLLQALAHRLAHLHGTHGGSVLGVVVADRLNAGLLNVVRSGEIGLAGARSPPRPAPSAFICLNMESMARVVRAEF